MSSQSLLQSNTLLPYDSLQNFPEDTDFIEIMRSVSSLIKDTKESQWSEHLEALNTLQRLHKFERSMFKRILYDLDLQDHLLKFVTSIRTSLSRAALSFLSIVFSQYEFEYNDDNEQIELVHFLEFFIPKIIDKSYSDKNFIKEEAQKCLNLISTYMLYGDVIITLLNECEDKSTKHSDAAFQALIQLISNFEKNYLTYYEKWNKIFNSVANISRKKKENYLKKPGRIILGFEEIIGKEKFSEIYRNYCTEEDKVEIDKAIEYYKEKSQSKTAAIANSTTESIKDFIQGLKEKKMIKKEMEQHEKNNEKDEIGGKEN